MILSIYLLWLYNWIQPVEYTTVSLWNDQYIKLKDGVELTLDETNGEDINSPVFGGMNYRLMASKGPRVKLPTIASNYLEIGIELTNDTENQLTIDRIKLLPQSLMPIENAVASSGRWVGIMHTNDYFGKLDLEVKSLDAPTVLIPTDLTVFGSSDERDSRLQLTVSIDDQLKQKETKLFSFQIQIDLIDLQTAKTISTQSDKTYHLAIQ
ncbi:hypothetical protein [Marinoscillum sp.]|uniref:hypothetical protein n=1 Tax=Marinoscillum sp. TaxID=2024838 RepID=UPI003BA9B44A